MVFHTPDHRLTHRNNAGMPNAQLVQRKGWNVGSTVGPYCVAWRDGEEIVLVWRDEDWHPIAGAYRKAG